MLRNDNRLIRNGDYILKSQVVDSYIQSSDYYFRYYLSTTGLTESEPLKIYLKDDELYKDIYTTDQDSFYKQINLYNYNNKNLYTFGNLDSVTEFRFYMSTYNNNRETGDLKSFIEQFKNLEIFSIMSSINQDFSYYKLPKNIKHFEIDDSLINGNVNTIENFNNIEKLILTTTKFSGVLSDINFKNFEYFYSNNNTEIEGDLTYIINNTNLNYLYLNYIRKLTINYTNTNVSNLTYIRINHYYSTTNDNATGDITNFTFNTGLTYFYFYINNANNYNITGNITNWDFSNTKCTDLRLYGYYSTTYRDQIYGDLSNWSFPDEMQNVYLYYLGITKPPINFSNTNLYNLYITYTNITSLDGLSLPNKSINYLNFSYNNIESISGITFNNANINYLNLYQNNISDDINDISDSNISGITTLYLDNNELYGNIHEFTTFSGVTNLRLYSNNITGYISGITFSDSIRYLHLSINPIYGDIMNMNIPDNLTQLYLNSTDIYIDFDSGVFNTNKLTVLYLHSISGITGDMSNFIIDDDLDNLYLYSIDDSYCDLSKLNITSNLRNLYLHNCNYYGDLTNFIPSGDTSLYYFYLYNNIDLSGDTSNWNINNTRTCQLYNTSLSGRLKHNNVYQLYIYDTNISSNISEDFNFDNQLYYFRGYNCNLTGNLSGVTLNSSFYHFNVRDNSNLYGSNEFINYIFMNRNIFTRTYCYIYIENIGDSVSGTTEELGDLGTYTGEPYDLAESQVNNLAEGNDYDGNGTNTPWLSTQKIYWIKNAEISSINTSKRYINYRIYY